VISRSFAREPECRGERDLLVSTAVLYVHTCPRVPVSVVCVCVCACVCMCAGYVCTPALVFWNQRIAHQPSYYSPQLFFSSVRPRVPEAVCGTQTPAHFTSHSIYGCCCRRRLRCCRRRLRCYPPPPTTSPPPSPAFLLRTHKVIVARHTDIRWFRQPKAQLALPPHPVPKHLELSAGSSIPGRSVRHIDKALWDGCSMGNTCHVYIFYWNWHAALAA